MEKYTRMKSSFHDGNSDYLSYNASKDTIIIIKTSLGMSFLHTRIDFQVPTHHQQNDRFKQLTPPIPSNIPN